nr:LOW QUALITY PROTEIN: U11/U12 small nuclear ribonucleoprotein 48 kDa protein-like [Aedes albopictus]
MDTRKAKLAEINNFIENANSTIDKMLHSFGWSRDVLQSKNKTSAPVGRQNLSSCRTESAGQHKSKDLIEEPLPESFLDGKHPCSIKFDHAPEQVPKSHKDLITNFTREERLAMYEQTIASTPKHESLPELQLNFKKRDNQERLTSLADIAAYRRDTHRRSQKYRFAKNPLSYQEEMRNLIQLQTDALAEYLGQSKVVDTRGKDRDSRKEADSSRSSLSNPQHVSREREKRRASRDVDERDKHKDRKSKKRRDRSRSRSRSRHKHKSKKKRSKDKGKHKSKH